MTPSPLRLKRIEAGLTQAQLSELSGLSQQMLSKLEKGERNMKPAQADMLARLLDCRAAELLPELALYQQPETESAEELELLKLYRRADPRGRKAVVTMLRALTTEAA